MAIFERTSTETRPFATLRACICYLNAVASLPFYKLRASQNFSAGACLSFVLLFQLSCSSNDNAHTTVTTVVPPPPRQVLTVVPLPTPGNESAASTAQANSLSPAEQYVGVDLSKPLLVLNLVNGKTFRVGEVVPIDFSIRNAKLRSEGGDFRVRYIIDDEDAQWVDNQQSFGLTGWVPGKHIIRLELIGPDGWPYRNGNQNIVTREMEVAP
jgi:hypothetical protein